MKIIYWVSTVIIAGTLGLSAIGSLMQSSDVVKGTLEMGYPAYLLYILGSAKLIASIIMLVPKFPRLKEWAYVGILIDYIGAGLSHLALNDFPHAAVLIVFIGIWSASYYAFHKLEPKGVFGKPSFIRG